MERNRIAVLRKEQGMNQKELGMALGVGQTTVSAWETGKNEPDAASLRKMAQLFHVSIGYLIGYENDSHRGLSGAEYAAYEAQKEAQQMGEDESGLSAQERAELIREAAEKFGSQCVVVAIDAKKRADGTGWNIYKNGGRLDVGIDAVEWAKKVESLGAGEILLTSMDGDGTKAGYDLELTRAIADSVSIPVIASGGAGTLEHFKEALTDGGADAALAASLFHYKELEIKEVKEYLRNEGISVRL